MNGLKDNLLNPDTWIRLFLIMGFYLVRMLLIWISGVFIAVQFLFVLITGQKNDNVNNAAVALGSYILEVTDFLTFARDTKPWPWSEFPDSSRNTEDVTFIDD
jgi:hypothetical protein